MMLLQTRFIVFILMVGVACSEESLDPLSSQESGKEMTFEYKPWLLNNVTSTSWISLDGMGLSKINSVLQLKVRDLSWLVMDNNNIRNVPPETFKFLPNLTYISLANNKINKFEIGGFLYLKTLQVLDLDGNPIDHHLDGCSIFGELSALKRLYLRKCELRSFDLHNCMRNLTQLYLSRNRIQAFFATSESAVTHLYLNDNEIRYMSLWYFKSLVYLNLSNNWLDRISPSPEIGPGTVYSSAKDINRVSYYPGDTDRKMALFLDGASELKYLNVSSNKIFSIEPDNFLKTEKLIHVDLTNNRISEIDHGTFSNLLQLEEILLDSNQIKKIHYRAFVNLPNLKIISLKNNQITDVSEDAFTKLNSNAPDLHLFLDNNKIHTLKRGSFMGVTGLKHIGLSKNRIKTISSQTFVNLPNLESVLIENQSVDETDDHERSVWSKPSLKKGIIESDAFFNLSNLTSIIIRGNLFNVIESQAFHTLPALTMLDLSNNSIEQLSSTAFYDLPEVTDLFLENNLILNIEPETFPKQLKQLNLAKNPLCPEFKCWYLEDLYQLEKLNVSGVIQHFKIDVVSALPENLTVVV